MIWRAGGAGLGALLMLVVFAAGVLAVLASLNPLPDTPGGAGGAAGGPVAAGDIPAGALALYVAAARGCPGLDWSVLAAIGKLETDHGRSTLPGVHNGANSAGSEGPMQFQPGTWAAVTARHPIPGGQNPPDPYNPHDAIFAAALYLCDNGAGNPGTVARSVWTYNHSQSYVSAVLAQAQQYRALQYRAQYYPAPPSDAPGPAGTAAGGGGSDQGGGGGGGSSAVAAAIGFARSQIGRPYVWGGNGATGFDCSGLVKAAYAAGGVSLPRTADAQFRAGPRLAPSEWLQPGDLVFYGGTPITHVALYVGDDHVIEARDVGTLITQDALPTRGYAGATRPTADISGHPTGEIIWPSPLGKPVEPCPIPAESVTLSTGCSPA
ncbi:MAG TPA: bifunctional lytic transglycosylase/C40 family peptidase [Pseudonocardiaceae bacterium]|nr:bifunctional lytic transglycosylase/C40 family peptidase [Pseudonocardiaceae bacterium]